MDLNELYEKVKDFWPEEAKDADEALQKSSA
jgi:hypothetical protein